MQTKTSLAETRSNKSKILDSQRGSAAPLGSSAFLAKISGRLLRAVLPVLVIPLWLVAWRVVGDDLVGRFGLAWVIGVIVGLTVMAFFFQTIVIQRQMYRQQIAELEKLVRTDDLTGLENDRSFRKMIARRGAGLILFDIDQFKSFNDTYGHPAGDEVLRQLGALLKGSHTVYRLGGDEFAVIVADLDGRTSAELAEFLWLEIRNHTWRRRPITASFGVATMPPTADPAELRNRADQALYQAKREGGDRVCVFKGP